ncbi:hypothetical protein ACFYNO_34205 [Kitasatospora sp. NPDC006697]|uniref:hypothetical protein n=1 Tax=Kitasatospora sp. NPDC006697 TaxID=3364020 RepID=UPI0036764E9B
MNFHAHKQAAEAMDELNAKLREAGLDFGDISSGRRIAHSGTVLAQPRPFYPIELLRLAAALKVPGGPEEPGKHEDGA